MNVGYSDSIWDDFWVLWDLGNGYCIFVDNLLRGVDWIYVNVQNLMIYDYKIFYFPLLNSIFGDGDYFYLSLWYTNLSVAGLQFFWSVLLDIYITNNLPQFSLTDEWVRSFITSKDASLLIVYHPEIIFFKNQILNNFFFEYLGDVSISVVSFLEREKLITPIMLLPQLIFLALMSFIFISFFFSYFTTSSNEESTIDADYLAASVMVEAEEEVGSIDDILMALIVFTYIFGWYFYLHCWALITDYPELALFFFFLPAMYYTILNVPLFLLYDFGIVFTCFLRGVSPTSILIFELMYDYIAIIAFYARMLTQSIRFVLMFLAYAAMHDYVLYMHFESAFHWGNESIWESLSNLDVSINSITYFILGVLPEYIMHWMYELIHTFFVITGQMVTYFLMIFWLFLFLFTFFVVETFERYFAERRLFRQKVFKKIKQIKQIDK